MTGLRTHSGWQYWLLGLFFGGLLPWLVNESSMTVYHKVVWLLLIVNGLYTVISGWLIGRAQHDGWQILIFPLMFALFTYVLKDNAHEYAYYLAVGYACVSYFVSGFYTGFTADHRSSSAHARQSQTVAAGKLAVGR
ncbi:MAG TPA: hypothetical protein DCW31_01865 [Lactobacillus sp.]|nr:hypothetical protein [Lactobacillus sp.]